MQQRLSLNNTLGIGFMTFALFLGAGNLIFPPMNGMMAGNQFWNASIGFLLTAVGLPLLAVVSIARTGGHFGQLTTDIPRSWAIVIGCTLFLIVGPFYGAPRTGLVAYEIGISPFVEGRSLLAKTTFIVIFFGLSWHFSLYPGKLLDSIGKVITPLLIVLLLALGLSPVFAPTGSPGLPLADYNSQPFLQGFFDGYLTMDTLAALMFGAVITTNLNAQGITQPDRLLRYSVIACLIAAIGLILVYLSLFYLGATSRELLSNPSSGSQLLAVYTEIHYGVYGKLLLAAAIILACWTTAIGLISAAANYFASITGRPYRGITTLITLCCLLFACMELDSIVDLFIPALMFIYPLAIVLILLGLARHRLSSPTRVYQTTLVVTSLFSFIDVAHQFLPDTVEFLAPLLSALPGYQTGLSWPLPMFFCLLSTAIFGRSWKSTPFDNEPG